MRPLLFIALACACATAPGPKRPEESHRVPVNRTVPSEVEAAVKANQAGGAQRQPRREGEVEWR
jgi:hypothetical protein